MLILSLESSAGPASAALSENGRLIALSYQNSGLTHSATLMPMVEAMLKNAGLSIKDVGAVAAAVGPGSFTGLRIGVAAAKGLAWGASLPCVSVSTLEAMAEQAACCAGIIAAVMDARRGQFYNAIFRSENGALERLTPDRATDVSVLRDELDALKESVTLVGDGAALCLELLKNPRARLAAPNIRFQSAAGVALVADRLAAKGGFVSCGELRPNYLRLSQAERERLERLEKEKNNKENKDE